MPSGRFIETGSVTPKIRARPISRHASNRPADPDLGSTAQESESWKADGNELKRSAYLLCSGNADSALLLEKYARLKEAELPVPVAEGRARIYFWTMGAPRRGAAGRATNASGHVR